MLRHDSQMQFAKVAPRRLRDAEALLQLSEVRAEEQGADQRHLRAAVYLAGYCIECILKTYLIAQYPPAQTLREVTALLRARGEEMPDLLSAEGHNLDLLLTLTGLEAALQTIPARLEDWNRCRVWQPSWRYDPEPPTRKFATEYIEATERLYNWIRTRI